MNEKWVKWFPIDKKLIEEKYFVGPIEVSEEDLVIVMEGKKYNIKFTFDGIPWSFRMTNESHRLLTFNKVCKKYGDAFLHNNSFFKVEDSDYSKWIVTESHGMYADDKIYNYVLMDEEWVIDVIDLEDPKIEIIFCENK